MFCCCVKLRDGKWVKSTEECDHAVGPTDLGRCPKFSQRRDTETGCAVKCCAKMFAHGKSLRGAVRQIPRWRNSGTKLQLFSLPHAFAGHTQAFPVDPLGSSAPLLNIHWVAYSAAATPRMVSMTCWTSGFSASIWRSAWSLAPT